MTVITTLRASIVTLSRVCLLLLAIAGLASTVEAQTVTELYVSPDTVFMRVGQRSGLTVQAFDNIGNAILRIGYRSTDDQVAVVQGGTVSAVRPGRAQVVVTAGKKIKAVQIIVRGDANVSSQAASPAASAGIGELATVVVEPTAIFLLPGEPLRAVANGLRADGTTVGPLRASWKSLRPDIATVVDTSGEIFAIAAGQGLLQASVGAQSATVPVFVTPAHFIPARERISLSVGESDTLAVLVPSQQGRRLRNGLQWATSDTSLTRISPDGIVQARAPGRAVIRIRGYQQEHYVEVLIHREIARFLTSPRLADTVRLPQLGSQEFKVRAEAADSSPVVGVEFSWSVGDSSIARFDSTTGILTARRTGTTSLTFAARGLVPKSWAIQVYAATVGFDRTRVALKSGQHSKLVASFLDDDNKPATLAHNLTWSSSNAGVARVQPDGTIDAIAPGRAVVSAVLGDGQPAAAVVFVTGDLLLSSSRSGKSGLYTIAPGAPDDLIPVAADTFSNNIDPAYSPDRTRIAFSSDRFAAGNFDIFVADADGRNPVRLTTDPGLDVQPSWTPDGSHIVFTSSRNGIRQIYLMKFDGTETRQLARVPGGSEDPVVSPDGKRVAFTGLSIDKEARRDIYVVELSGGVPVAATLTRDQNERLPAYLPNGELVYLLDRKDKKEPSLVLRQYSTGAPPATLLSSEAPILTIALSPDGERLAWATVRQVDRAKSVLETTLKWRSLTTGAETSVHLLPGEKITSAAF